MTTFAVIAATLALPFAAGLLTGLYNWAEAHVKYTLERRATDRAVDVRMATPLPVERLVLTEPWPARQTPTDLAAAYETPAPAPDRVSLDGPTVPAREQATIGDRYACDDPCTARHCIHHAGVVGSIAQRFRWNTDTAEFSLLGLTVPDFLDVRSVVFQEAT